MQIRLIQHFIPIRFDRSCNHKPLIFRKFSSVQNAEIPMCVFERSQLHALVPPQQMRPDKCSLFSSESLESILEINFCGTQNGIIKYVNRFSLKNN